MDRWSDPDGVRAPGQSPRFRGTEAPGPVPLLSAVLPLRLSGDAHFEAEGARAHALLQTLKIQGYQNLLSELALVVPEQDQAAARALATAHPELPLEVRREDAVAPALGGVRPRQGYQKQMLLKLAFAAQQPHGFVLTLDADLLACRPAAMGDFVQEGRAVTQWEPRSLHRAWWRGSGMLLALPWWRSGWGMSVTPAVLVPEVARWVMERLRRIHRTEPARALLRWHRLQWTEYTLYHLAAERSGLLGSHHTPRESAGVSRLIHPESVWYPQGAPLSPSSENEFRAPTRLDTALFLVFQSRADIPPQVREAMVNRIAIEAGSEGEWVGAEPSS